MIDPVARVEPLRAARRSDSQAKRARVASALASLESAGVAITFPAVARAAGVSTWLVYAPGVREQVETARRRQVDAVRSSEPEDRTRRSGGVSPAGLRTDLALARAEITRLRTEVASLRHRLRLQLGAEIEGPDRATLIARLAELEGLNRCLAAERDSLAAEAGADRQRRAELEDEVTAVRESLRRVMRAQNRA